MAKIFTTEITSDTLSSDNPIHQRLFKAYIVAEDHAIGDVLEVGCGEGRGVHILLKKAASFTAVDKMKPVIEQLQRQYPAGRFISMNIPPLSGLADNAYDFVASFQVIEHIDDDKTFLKEIHRVLKPGGIAMLTTPNRKMSLSRNPWHVREYLPDELTSLAGKYFKKVTMRGITGNQKVMAYYAENKKSVERITKWDFLDLQHKLPASILRIPYEVLNRWNRNKLQGTDQQLVSDIRHEDYIVVEDASDALDLLLTVEK